MNTRTYWPLRNSISASGRVRSHDFFDGCVVKPYSTVTLDVADVLVDELDEAVTFHSLRWMSNSIIVLVDDDYQHSKLARLT